MKNSKGNLLILVFTCFFATNANSQELIQGAYPLYLAYQQSQLWSYSNDRSFCRAYYERQSFENKKSAVAGDWRNIDDYCRTTVGTANAHHQKNMDQFDDLVQQRNMFFADGAFLLPHRLQKLWQASELAKNLRHELYSGIHALRNH